MANYVDGYVLMVPQKKLDDYKKMAKIAAKVWVKHGALDYKECILEDKKPNKYVTLTFPKMTQSKRSEVIIFAYATYKSRAHRDRVNAKVMVDPEMTEYEDMPMPFDMDRMAFGGFEVIIDGLK